MAILAGEKATAARINEEIGAALSDIQNASGTTTSTTYTATLTGGTACGLAFIAPPSGKVLILWNVNQTQSTSVYVYCTIRVRTGGVVGSGTDVLAASDNEAIIRYGAGVDRQGGSRLLTGLTAGSSYNVQQLFRVDSGTGTFSNKNLTAMPQL